MAKYPFLTHRSGSQNWYYKRDVPPELRAPGRSKQIWKSLGTSDRKRAEKAYAVTHADIELKLEQWRQDDNRPVATTEIAPSASGCPSTALTPALLRKLADSHYLTTYETDFAWRGDLWRRTREDEDAFWRGKIVKHPTNDWQKHVLRHDVMVDGKCPALFSIISMMTSLPKGVQTPTSSSRLRLLTFARGKSCDATSSIARHIL